MGNQAQNFLPELTAPEGPQPGPSWQNERWPLDDGGDLTQALDPTAMKLAIREASAKAGKPVDEGAIERAAADSIRAMMLVRTYRVRGHLAANLDPLGLTQHELPDDLKLDWHGFSGEALDREVYVGGTLGLDWVRPRELVTILRKNYCGHVGLEYMHLADVEARLYETYFAWVGETNDDSVFYYRIHSPVVLIEFDHQTPVGLTHLYPRGVPYREHIHAVVRTPNGNDYGKDLLRQHYERHPH